MIIKKNKTEDLSSIKIKLLTIQILVAEVLEVCETNEEIEKIYEKIHNKLENIKKEVIKNKELQ